MAARKTPPPRKPGTTPAKPVAQAKAAQAKKLGYTSVEAMQSVARWAKAGKSNVIPHAAMVAKIAEENGWSMAQQALGADTPVNIGGYRWMLGKSGYTFTGERSDAAKRKPGAAWSGNGAGAGGTVPITDGAGPGDGGLFTTGVSGATGKFVTEAGGKGPAGEMPEPGKATKTKKSKAKTKKLVKRTVKKTNVKGKAIRQALKSPGITKSDKKTYAKVAKQATPKLSNRLRQRDRRK